MTDDTSRVVQTWIPIEPVRLDEYTLVARLGQGGMAEIYLAVHHGLSGFRKLVVIKRLLPHMADRPEVVEMFLDEARLAARLSHPNVVATTKIGTSGGHYFLAMDFIDGLPLNRVLVRAQDHSRRLAPEVVAKIVSDALAGLHYAHDAADFDGTPLGVVHRDVSPHNLMVGYDGITKVLDFGIAKASLQEHATRTGLIKGKFAYIAPEQATGDDLDRRADVWSVGVVLWEALAGRRLFKGKTDVGTLQEALTKPIPSLLELHQDTPRELAEICDRALQRDADDRYPSALAMKQAIDEWLGSRSYRGSHEEVARVVGELFDGEHREQRRLLKALTRFGDDERGTMRDLGTLSTAVSLPEGAVAVSISASRLTPASVSHVRAQPATDVRVKAAVVAVCVLLAAGLAWWTTRPTEAAAPQGEETRDERPANTASSPPPTSTGASEPRPNAAVPDPVPTTTAVPSVAPPGPDAVEEAVHEPETRERPRPARPRPDSMAQTVDPPPAPPAEPPPAPTEFGFLTLDTNPWSIVSVGGRRLGNTPLVRARLPAGTHVLELTNPELDLRTTYTVVIEPNQTFSRRIGIE
ncbi:MAG: protein kinase [Myxococcota bacterium]|nr:protein kinase [Myxococcota bacterium]